MTFSTWFLLLEIVKLWNIVLAYMYLPSVMLLAWSQETHTFLFPFNLKSYAWWDCNPGQLYCWGLVGELVSNLPPIILHELLHSTSGFGRGRSGEIQLMSCSRIEGMSASVHFGDKICLFSSHISGGKLHQQEEGQLVTRHSYYEKLVNIWGFSWGAMLVGDYFTFPLS